MKSPIYRNDFPLWSEKLATTLCTDNFASLDKDVLLEQLEDMGNVRKEALQSLIRNILAHLLKLAYSSATDLRSRWEAISEFRARADTKLDNMPSPKHYGEVLHQKYWPQA